MLPEKFEGLKLHTNDNSDKWLNQMEDITSILKEIFNKTIDTDELIMRTYKKFLRQLYLPRLK